VKVLLGGFYNGEELARLRYDGLPLIPAVVHGSSAGGGSESRNTKSRLARNAII